MASIKIDAGRFLFQFEPLAKSKKIETEALARMVCGHRKARGGSIRLEQHPGKRFICANSLMARKGI